MSINCKYAVVAAEPAVLSSQPPFQKVENKNSRLIRSAYKFNAKLLAGVAFVQRHLKAVFARGAGGVRVAVRAAAEPPLPQHGEVQHRAGLRKHGSSVVVGHVAYVKAIDLQCNNNNKNKNGIFMCLSVPSYGNEVLSKPHLELTAKPTLEQPTYLTLPDFLAHPSILSCKPTLAAQSTKPVSRLEKTLKIIQSTINITLPSPPLHHVSKCHIYTS